MDDPPPPFRAAQASERAVIYVHQYFVTRTYHATTFINTQNPQRRNETKTTKTKNIRKKIVGEKTQKKNTFVSCFPPGISPTFFNENLNVRHCFCSMIPMRELGNTNHMYQIKKLQQ